MVTRIVQSRDARQPDSLKGLICVLNRLKKEILKLYIVQMEGGGLLPRRGPKCRKNDNETGGSGRLFEHGMDHVDLAVKKPFSFLGLVERGIGRTVGGLLRAGNAGRYAGNAKTHLNLYGALALG